MISVVATVSTLFGVGAMKTMFSRKNWVRSGLEMMIIGASAAAITHMIGTLLRLQSSMCKLYLLTTTYCAMKAAFTCFTPFFVIRSCVRFLTS
ncbi:MAG: VIT1/CCC1 transporter family protein [Candidatus Bathyarchaeia archaeon]